jgi:pyruvate/2-oxoglutarate dehydrogenase complex dihydrolipoamide acyltransferase (E2) component
MATDVVMPQLGEQVSEGTIVRWIKKVGDHVERDEPLFEVSTDKVDAEIPAPVTGVLTEIRVKEGDTVPVASVIALIGNTTEDSETATAIHSTGRRALDFGDGVLISALAQMTAAGLMVAFEYGFGWHWISLSVLVAVFYANIKNKVPVSWYVGLVVMWLIVLLSLNAGPLLVQALHRG